MASCLVSWTIMIAVLVASSARADDLIVFSSGAPADAQKSIAADSMPPQSKPVFTVAMPAALLAKLAAGEKADVLVMPEQALAGLEAAGKLAPSRRVAVARVGVGVVVRQGAAVPDVGTVDALRAALIAAPSVVYPDPASEGSVAGRAINRMLT